MWEQEIKNNPQLFKTIIIPEQFANTKEDIFDLELKWQIEFDVVKNNLFTNMCFAKGNFFSNSESAKKAVQTRRKNGRYIDSEETRKKKSLSAKGKPKSQIVKDKIRKTLTGRKRPDEVKKKVSKSKKDNPTVWSLSQLEHFRNIQTGKKMWNNGEKNTWATESPGPEWRLGKLK